MKYSIAFIVLAVVITACNSKEGKADSLPPAELSDYQAENPGSISPDALELPMPVIPDSITDVVRKRVYAGQHFWDTLDFRDTVRSLNDAFMEQNFSNFIVFLNAQPDERAKKQAFTAMLSKAKAEPKAFDKLKYIVKLYLADPGSPMRSEELWIPYLEVMTNDPQFSNDSDNLRYEFELEMAKKNRWNTKASDFKYITREGRNSNLHKTSVGSKGLILVFYDPDCDSCRETIAKLRDNVGLNEMISNGEYTVLAVDSRSEYDDWKETVSAMPANWTVAYNTDGVEDNDVYYFPSMPVVYVLDPQYKVMVKDAVISPSGDIMI